MSDLSPPGPGTAEIGMKQAKGQDPQAPSPTKIGAGTVRERWNSGTRNMKITQRQYAINKAAVSGDQWTWWNKGHDRLEQMAKVERVRATVNKLGPASRALIAKACERDLVFEVMPEGPDDAAIQRANIAESVLEDAARRYKFEDMRETEFSARWEGGTALICLDWNPKAGTPLGTTDDGDDFGTGDVEFTVLSISEATTEAGSRDIEQARWWIKAMCLPPKDVQAKFALTEAPPADATAALGAYQAATIGGTDQGSHVPQTLVLTYYERPNPLCKKGQVAVVVDNEVVQWSPWPFPFTDRLNVVCFREKKQGNRWFGETILSSAQPVQVGLNASWSSILEHLKRASNARLAIPDTSIDSVDQLTDTPGEDFFYNPAGPPPSYMAPPNMPAWWVQMPSLLDSALQDILSWHDTSQGNAPANLESGLGLSILTEGDDAPMRKMLKETKGGWERLASMFLATLAAKVSESRKSKVEGPGQAPRIVGWSGKDLKGCDDVVIPLDAIMPTSEAAAHARAQALWDRKIISDPKVYARLARLPLTKDLLAALDPDLAKAQRENEDLSNGAVCIPAAFDDHAKHIAAHNDYRKSEAYEHLDATPSITVDNPTPDPETGMPGPPVQVSLQGIVDMHVQAHETMAAEAAATQLAQQMVHPALGGSPNASGQQPVADGDVPLPPQQVSASAPPALAPPAGPPAAPSGVGQ